MHSGAEEVNREQYLLSCLAEECAEVAQRASKALRFGMKEVQPGQDKSNARRLSDEMTDLVTVYSWLVQTANPNLQPSREKSMKIKKYMEYSRELGILEGL